MINNARLNNANSVSAGGSIIQTKSIVDKENIMFPDYSIYPPSDDIYNKGEKVELNPEDLTTIKDVVEKPVEMVEMDFGKELLGSDLDVPGAELYDNLEDVGSGDEENNYYSLGGDGHTALDEDMVGS